MQNLLEYEDIKFQNASKEDLKLSDEDKGKKQEKKLRETFKPLTKWWRKLLGDDGNLEAVRVSNRLSTTPCIVVASKCGSSCNICVLTGTIRDLDRV
jgi:heat shock protein 90kDa beta